MTQPATPRDYGAINLLGLKTLYEREVRRFMKVAVQTVFGPVVSTWLLMAVFVMAFGADTRTVSGIPFPDFLVPGLIMLTVIQNAFANSSSSLIVAKVQGTTSDFLMPPLSAGELTLGFIAGATTRGVMVAVATATITPRVVAPAMKPRVSSPADSGGIRKSLVVPCTLATISEDEELANAFWITVSMIRPGTRKSGKGMPLTVRVSAPKAITNTAISSQVETTGPNTVCTATFMKRRTSRSYRVFRPRRLIAP